MPVHLPVHVLVKLGPVAVVILVVVRDKEVGVDHLVQEGLHQVLAGAKLQQWYRDPWGVCKNFHFTFNVKSSMCNLLTF